MAHRPSDETLAAFAGGHLDEGLSLAVAAHVELNSESRRLVHELQAVRGALLDRIEPIAMSTGAPDPAGQKPLTDTPVIASPPTEPGMPNVLRPYALGPWQPIGIRVAMRRIKVPGAQARVFMLRAGPGIALPHHKHTGFEWTTILSGAYEHEYGRYAAGDFDEADTEHDHTPRVDPVEGCTCLVAMTGNVLFQGWLGRLLQPLVRL
ncbi:ChrR family anti-sigma-E factor [Bosea sp. NPDC055332]